MLIGISITSLSFRRYGILCILISSIFIAFTLGFSLAKYRATNLNLAGLKEQIIGPIEGTISNLKQTTRGTQIILEDTLIKKHQEISKVRINIKAEYSNDLMLGDRISVFAALQPPPRSLIPGGYDFGLYAYFAGLQATGYALFQPQLIDSRSRDSASIKQIRRFIHSRLIATLGSTQGNFAAAILLGEGAGLDRKVMQDMRYSGISHILCVSGLHLSLVAMLFFIVSRFLLNLSDRVAYNYNIKVIAAMVSLIGSFGYLLLSGMQIAATRAFIMTSIFILSIILGRAPYPLRSICIAAVIILSVNPEYILHPSFQLSFIAVISLITGYEFYIRNQWILGSNSGLLSNIKLYIFSNIYSSLTASLATMPIVIYHFYISSNYSILANLVAVPIMSFFMMPLAILAVIIMPFKLDYYVLKLLGYFIQLVIDLADWISHLPGSIWYFGYISPLSLTIYIIGFFWLTLWQKKWRHFGWVVILISLGLMFISPKPDFIYDPKMKVLGIKNGAGKLEIYAKHISGFMKNYWANWYGQADVVVHKSKTNILPHSIFNQDNSLICGPKNLSNKELEKYGTVLIFFKGGQCKILYNENIRFKFK